MARRIFQKSILNRTKEWPDRSLTSVSRDASVVRPATVKAEDETGRRGSVHEYECTVGEPFRTFLIRRETRWNSDAMDRAACGTYLLVTVLVTVLTRFWFRLSMCHNLR